MRKFVTVDKITEYNTAYDSTNAPESVLVSGSQNVLIDARQGKVKKTKRYTRLGVANTALTPVRNAWTWNNSTGKELPQRFYDDELEVYLGTIDGVTVDAWTRVKSGLSTTKTLRPAIWWDAVENIDLQLMVQGDTNIYEWNGAVAVIDSITATTITKKSTTTFAQNRFYTSRNKTVVCVRTGTEYTYTGGEDTTTLMGIADTTGLIAGDVLIQKLLTDANKPSATRTNDTIFVWENQVILGSFDDNEIYVSQNDDYDDFTYSAPRIAGEGGLLTLDSSSAGFGELGSNLIVFSGRDSVYKANHKEIAVGTTLTETLEVKKLDAGAEQGALSPDCIFLVGGYLVYISNEPSLRMLDNPDSINSFNPKILSDPIKPDFDAEDFTDAFGIWWKGSAYISSPVNSRLYILEFTRDANGELKRFWQPPQIFPVRAFSIIGGDLYIHSNSVPETYKLFDGYSDTGSDDSKLPVNCVAAYSYRNFANRSMQKNFDEIYVEGEISPATRELELTLNYNYGGYTQKISKMIDGTDESILEESIEGVSLGQESLGVQPIGGSSDAPPESRKFRVIFEVPREDFNEVQFIFSNADIDTFFSILSTGLNAVASPRKQINIKQ